MPSIALASADDFHGWREAARGLLAAEVPPQDVSWHVAGEPCSLFDDEPLRPATASASTLRVPSGFIDLARRVALHRGPARFALLYRLLWRLRLEARLLDLTVDEDVARAHALERAVERDIHKMRAFVRFRAARGMQAQRFVAWFEPEHHIVAANAGFFVRRFANHPWSILTPERSVHWDTRSLTFGPGARRSDAPADDAAEDLWRSYYASIFNPARLKVPAMLAHMPKKYWRNLPESELIAPLIGSSQKRTLEMITKSATTAHKRRAAVEPKVRRRAMAATSLEAVRRDAAHCRDCPLWKNATQTVFGEGDEHAKVIFVGEQPGDQEDLAGLPFVGPAGKLLDRALEDADVDRKKTYVTNAVKHFKFEPRGKRRIHKKPSDLEIAACHQWLEREIELLQPSLVVVLGATAARSVFGRATPIEKNRGRIIKAASGNGSLRADILVTVHPSFLLRVPPEDKPAAYARFVEDLKLVRPYVK